MPPCPGTATQDQQQFCCAKNFLLLGKKPGKLLLILPVQRGHAIGVGTRNVNRIRHACGASNKELWFSKDSAPLSFLSARCGLWKPLYLDRIRPLFSLRQIILQLKLKPAFR